MRQVQFEGMTDSEKNDFINFIYGQLKEREAQKELRKSQREAKKYGRLYEEAKRSRCGTD